MNSTSVGHTFPEKFGAANEDNVEEMGRTFQENGVRMIHNALTGVHFFCTSFLGGHTIELELKLRVVQLSICTEIEVHLML